jgi:hypothetical protein
MLRMSRPRSCVASRRPGLEGDPDFGLGGGLGATEAQPTISFTPMRMVTTSNDRLIHRLPFLIARWLPR